MSAFFCEDAYSTVLVAENEDVIPHDAFCDRRAAGHDSAAECDGLPIAP
jgi:hypothetical protein